MQSFQQGIPAHFKLASEFCVEVKAQRGGPAVKQCTKNSTRRALVPCRFFC